MTFVEFVRFLLTGRGKVRATSADRQRGGAGAPLQLFRGADAAEKAALYLQGSCSSEDWLVVDSKGKRYDPAGWELLTILQAMVDHAGIALIYLTVGPWGGYKPPRAWRIERSTDAEALYKIDAADVSLFEEWWDGVASHGTYAFWLFSEQRPLDLGRLASQWTASVLEEPWSAFLLHDTDGRFLTLCLRLSSSPQLDSRAILRRLQDTGLLEEEITGS